jgi:hypothetical protein
MDLHHGLEEEEEEEEGEDVAVSLVRGDWDCGERVSEVWNWEEKRKGERRLEVEDEEFLRTSVEAIEVNRRKFENRERERERERERRGF